MSDKPKPVTPPKPKRQRNWRPKKRRKRIKLVQLTFFELWEGPSVQLSSDR